MGLIDDFLNRTTMYRLVLYVLTGLLAASFLLGSMGFLPHVSLMILVSVAVITAVCAAVNRIFATLFRVQTNVESTYISAFILVLIITPPRTFLDGQFLETAVWASAIAMASKYIVAIRGKHVFNPVALAVTITSFALHQSASWWVGTAPMMPFVLVGGLLIVRKIRRWGMTLSCIIAAIVSILGVHLDVPLLLPLAFQNILLLTPLLFLATVLLTEPLTTPPTKGLQIMYGTLVGVLFAPWIHIGSYHFTPELALLLGNIFSYIVSPKQKLILTLHKKVPVAAGVEDFQFTTEKKLPFRPGQYLEWTLGHRIPDARGNRRYFTISSSPTEQTIDIGVKFSPESSSYKKDLRTMQPGGTIIASQLAGDFTMPHNRTKKLVFIAGGIGVTPFRSMIKYLLDTGELRDIVLLYSNRTKEDIAYKEVFDEAQKKLGIKTVYTLTGGKTAPAGWTGYTGYIDRQMIEHEVPDYRDRIFYLSGPDAMITAFEKTLRTMGIRRRRIKKDYFPGFA